MRFLIGFIIGATVMYLFDPRQGPERREVWGERLRKGKDQAEQAVETGKHTFEEAKAKAQEVTNSARHTLESVQDEAEEAAAEAESSFEDVTEQDRVSNS
ncbi:MAG TPA: YtxH domain-containing protein [Dehalococcoidia bacterium]|nr:YtxH domain-containing protein [Dehalococcoidia bacterium]